MAIRFHGFRTEAKTAYGLLSAVQRLILEEPKRYNQRNWIRRIEDFRYFSTPDQLSNTFPACGTIACVGGWVATLFASPEVDLDQIPHIAKQILGLTNDQASELFDATGGGRLTGGSGTLLYALQGVAHIKRFKQKYAQQLKATALPPRKKAAHV